jgi:dCTP deaminase
VLLTDDEIRTELGGPKPFAVGVTALGPEKDSQVQPSSLDLSIGAIYKPETNEPDGGSLGNPLSRYRLEAGQTAVIQTLESLLMPDDLAAIGFPPSRVSSQGLLMTNPGHVDPGYQGPLTFTVINMAKQPYHLVQGDRIVTLLLLPLSKPAADGWSKRRNGKGGEGVTPRMLDVLSSDFLSVNDRAVGIARRQVFRSGLVVLVTTILVAVFAAVLTFLPTYAAFTDRSNDDREQMAQIVSQLSQIEARMASNEDLELRLERLEDRVQELTRP